MVPALLSTESPLLGRHAIVGCSTGYMESERGDWPRLVAQAAAVSSLAVELSAVSEPELPGLLDYLLSAPQLPFRYVSVHAPSKVRELPEAELVAILAGLPPWIDAIVVHPDTIQDPDSYRPLGRLLVLENMDSRKPAGRTVDELDGLFEALPQAGLCFDIAHAKAVDETLNGGDAILKRFADRLRHVHLSSLDAECHHVSLSSEDEELFTPLLESCRDVPWILEAPPPGS
jgi:Xylose isomerase-like TIM barrel